VIDLSPAGRQPMGNEDGTVWITYNGEIYNFPELREELAAKGHHFQSATDTEVILHLYEKYGEACVERLNGMFAFAIWDGRHDRLFAARDHLGIKPLYYAHRARVFAFASEIKALLAADLVRAEVDWQAIYDYFTLLHIPNPATAFRDVRQLPPGHTLVYEPGANSLRLHRYWQPRAMRPGGEWRATEWIEQFRELMSDAVRRQLVSDVPLGCLLSGGLDSTVLVGLMARHARRVKSFTVHFEGRGTAQYDEREAAARVARRYGTEHHEFVVDISDPAELLEMVGQFDQPFGNPTFFLSALVARYTRGHVTVGLTGAGGDELFAGYPRYQAVAWAQHGRRIPTPALRLATMASRFLPASRRFRQFHRCRLFLEGLERGFEHRYLKWTYYLDEGDKKRLLGPGFRGDGATGEPLDTARILERHLALSGAPDDLGRIRDADLLSFLPDNILEYTDKTSSAVGLEMRVPFLDPRVVASCLEAPVAQNLARGGKALLKEAYGALIPPENLRAAKKGFCPPLALWMERHFDRYFDQHLSRSYLAEHGIFDWNVLQQLREENRSRRRDNSMELFGILMFDAWYRRYITREQPDALAEVAARPACGARSGR
jgi:asparagine synthase (glutamine-hydrolysing)